MGEPHVISALSNKRAELAGIVIQLERQLGQQQADLAHLDATMRLFDPDIRPNRIRARQQRARSAWFRPGECLRLIYVAAIRQRVAKGTTVHADESAAWNPLHASFAMQRINHQDGFSIDGACTNNAESYFSRLHELRDAVQPMTTRELARADHARQGPLNRAKETIARVEAAGVVSWRL